MKKFDVKTNLFWWCAGGVVTVSILGTVLHFLYDWTGSEAVVPFSAIDESTWQHMKILYFPMVIFGSVQWLFFKDEYKSFWVVKLIGTAVGLALIPVLFYTYNGAFGKSPDWLNIAIFVLSAIGGYGAEYILFKKNCISLKHQNLGIILALIGIISMGILFVVLTYLPPNLPLFQDPTK